MVGLNPILSYPYMYNHEGPRSNWLTHRDLVIAHNFRLSQSRRNNQEWCDNPVLRLCPTHRTRPSSTPLPPCGRFTSMTLSTFHLPHMSGSHPSSNALLAAVQRGLAARQKHMGRATMTAAELQSDPVVTAA